jgi:hypothetical protein
MTSSSYDFQAKKGILFGRLLRPGGFIPVNAALHRLPPFSVSQSEKSIPHLIFIS